MQASRKYQNELSCMSDIIDSEGLGGLLSRGLGTTLGREIPSYGIYFFIYGFLSQTPIANALGPISPLIFGALSGMASWLPVYPIDVVKTLVQNTDGSDSISSIDVARQLYLERGIGGFFDGLAPKVRVLTFHEAIMELLIIALTFSLLFVQMMRAAVNHAATFYLYDIVFGMLSLKKEHM